MKGFFAAFDEEEELRLDDELEDDDFREDAEELNELLEIELDEEFRDVVDDDS